MTLKELEVELSSELKAHGLEQPGFEARQILLSLLGVESSQLLLQAESEVAVDLLHSARRWMKQRARGYPLAYLAGRKGFFKHEFLVTPGVLIPRPETELVVEEALRWLGESQIERLADLGCGSGCLGLSLLAELSGARLYALDSSQAAVELTRRNAELLRLEARTEVILKRVEDWRPKVKLDMIVANPPYIALDDRRVEKSVHDFEPHAALYSGLEGLDALRAWIKCSRLWLKPAGILLCEIGTGQSSQVSDIMKTHGFEHVRVSKDLAGHDRVVSARLPQEDANG